MGVRVPPRAPLSAPGIGTAIGVALTGAVAALVFDGDETVSGAAVTKTKKQKEKPIFPDAKYTVQELRDCSGACHIYEDATLTTIKDFRASEHRVGDSDFD